MDAYSEMIRLYDISTKKDTVIERTIELMQISSNALIVTSTDSKFLEGYFFAIEIAINSIKAAIKEQKERK